MYPVGTIDSNKKVQGGESGFTGFPFNPLIPPPSPPAPAAVLPYPQATAPTVMASDGTPWNNDTTRSDNGPVRNVDFTLVQYAGGVVYSVNGPGGPTPAGAAVDVNPGGRWEIGIGLFPVGTTKTHGH